MCEIGRAEDASQAFIDALEDENRVERDRQEDHRRLRLRFLEEAVLYDQRASNADAAFGKLRQIAEIVHPDDQKAQARYLFGRAGKYQEIGRIKGDKSALLVAIAAFSWLAKDTVNVDRT
jgi:hypothetical protein